MQNACAGQPFLRNRDGNQLWCDEGESEHGGKGDERRKAEHLAEDAELPLVVVGYLGEQRLRHAADHARDERMTHIIPFVSLIELSDFALGIETAEDDGEEVIIDVVEDVCEQEFETKRQHFAERTEVEAKRRPPRTDTPKEKRQNADVNKTLGRDAPIRETVIGQCDACNARNDERKYCPHRLLLHLHIAEKVCRRNNTQSGDEETDERVAGQRNQIRIMVEAGNQGRTEKKNPVKAEAEKRAKPKNSVEIPMLYYFSIGECRDEPAFLNSGGDE